MQGPLNVPTEGTNDATKDMTSSNGSKKRLFPNESDVWMMMDAAVPAVAETNPFPEATHREASTGPAVIKTEKGAATIKSPVKNALTNNVSDSVGEMLA